VDDIDALKAISPIDGRYDNHTRVLEEYFSEYALIKERTTIEVKYLLALREVEEIPFSLDDEEQRALHGIYRQFSIQDAAAVSQIERAGRGGIGPTAHDVKAVEYYLRERLTAVGLARLNAWTHFALTSEDVDNLAYGRLIHRAMQVVILPALLRVADRLSALGEEYKALPMLGHTHGQPASPTTLGKEFSVYLLRLSHGIEELARQRLPGKLGGATGNLNAHRFAYPDVDWIEFARRFVRNLGLEPSPVTTQVQGNDELAALLTAVARVNNVLLDLAVDVWLYLSLGYLRLSHGKQAVGSSTMPHKVNPIDFENSEGNLAKANCDLCFLANYLTRSRLQRDLSGSTVRRTIGTALAHGLLAYQRLQSGLKKISAHKQGIATDLSRHFEVLAEAAQIALRRQGVVDSFERVKARINGERIDEAGFAALVEGLSLAEGKLARLTPSGYIGYARELAELAIEESGQTLRRVESGLAGKSLSPQEEVK